MVANQNNNTRAYIISLGSPLDMPSSLLRKCCNLMLCLNVVIRIILVASLSFSLSFSISSTFFLCCIIVACRKMMSLLSFYHHFYTFIYIHLVTCKRDHPEVNDRCEQILTNLLLSADEGDAGHFYSPLRF